MYRHVPQDSKSTTNNVCNIGFQRHMLQNQQFKNWSEMSTLSPNVNTVCNWIGHPQYHCVNCRDTIALLKHYDPGTRNLYLQGNVLHVLYLNLSDMYGIECLYILHTSHSTFNNIYIYILTSIEYEEEDRTLCICISIIVALENTDHTPKQTLKLETKSRD